MSTPSAKARILVVDDDSVVRKICQKVLEGDGYAVEMAENGQQALDRIIEKDFDLLLTDMEMPVMDGMTLLEKLRDVPVAPPSILMTTHSNVVIAVQALKRGAYDFITKPFVGEILLAAVRHCLENHQLKKEVESLRTNQLLIPLFEAVADAEGLEQRRRKFLTMACGLFEADGGSLLLYDPEAKSLVVSLVHGEYPQNIVGEKISLGERVAGHAAEVGRLITLHGPLNQDPRFAALSANQPIHSSMCVPLVAQRRPVAVLCLKRVSNRNLFTAKDEQTLGLIACFGALTLI